MVVSKHPRITSELIGLDPMRPTQDREQVFPSLACEAALHAREVFAEAKRLDGGDGRKVVVVFLLLLGCTIVSPLRVLLNAPVA